MADYHRLLIGSSSGPVWNVRKNLVPATEDTDVIFDGSEMRCPDCGGVLDTAEDPAFEEAREGLEALEAVACRCGSQFAPVDKTDHAEAGDNAPTPGSGDGMPGQGRHWKLPPRRN